MSTRDLRVRFVGDAAGLKASFAEVNAAAAAAGSGLKGADVDATNVGKSFTRTGKLFKATGKVFKNSGLDALAAGSAFASTIPALAGVSSGLGAFVTQADGLVTVAGSLGAFALPAMGASAIAAAAAYAFLHDDVSAATDVLRSLEDEAKKVKTVHRDVAVAALQQREATRGLRSAMLNQEGAALSLEQANRDLAAAQKEYGRGSLEARTAALGVQQAEDRVRETRRAAVDQAQAAIAASKRRSKATDAEAAALARQKKEAEKAALGLKLGIIAGDDRAAAEKKVKDALDASSKASQRAEARHRANAKESRAAAAELKGETNPALVAFRKHLLAAANTELDLANAIQAMRDLAAAADTAAGGVTHVYDLLRNPPASPTVRVRTLFSGAGGGGGGKGGKKGSDEFTGAGKQTADARGRRGITPLRGELTSLTFADVAGGIIGARHRDDSLQDKIAASRARADARKSGISNPDKVSALEDKRVAEVRKKEIEADINTVKRQRIKLRQRVLVLRKRLAGQRTSRRKAKKDDQPDWDSRIQDTLSRIRGLWDQDRAMARDLAELRAEAKELGFDISVLEEQIAEMPSVVPDDDDGSGTGGAGGSSPVTPEEALDTAAALAALTPGVADDISVAEQAVAHYERSLAAAQSAGDVRATGAAATALFQARATLEQLKATRDNTDAVEANTAAINDAFGGSTAFSYRGQGYVLRSLAPPSSDDLRAVTI